jgi:hypothetical protein
MNHHSNPEYTKEGDLFSMRVKLDKQACSSLKRSSKIIGVPDIPINHVVSYLLTVAKLTLEKSTDAELELIENAVRNYSNKNSTTKRNSK